MTTATPASRATLLGITNAGIPAATPWAIQSRNPMSRIVK
jgi:hypothetical protein